MTGGCWVRAGFMSGEVVSPARTAVLPALLADHQENGRATVRSVMRRAGLHSTSTTHAHLCALRRAGLVVWEPGRDGTLRPLVGHVGLRP